MGVFKLFTNIMSYPDAIIIVAFIFLMDIIMLVKIDKLEKEVEKIKKKIAELETAIQQINEENQTLNEEKDIIDNFLSQSGFNILGKTKKSTNKKSVKEAMKAPKISSLMDPNESDEEDDK